MEVIPAKACVRVGNPAGLAQNDRALLIQMKGASINTASSSAFGDTVSMANAGNYELGTICYIRGDSVFFVYMLLNSYTVSGKVQLVRVPEYSSAIVTDTLRASPWNNTTGMGGVVAIYVDNDLTLNAPISADSSGFRGGGYRLSNGTCNNTPGANGYDYNANSLAPQNGAFKGEGVADVATAQSGGRGAPANGGGGGNNHNNGGAGGANLSAGGDGGGNSSSTGCNLAYVGKGGKALSSYGGTKLYLGGGGGAGHVNNGFVVSNGGGHGGGIVFVRANTLIGNSQIISANGQVGGAAASDGASGGGGGGTVVMAVTNYSGGATIAANGGQGGTEDDGLNINKCYGSGGGGSGGVIYFSGATPALTVTTAGGAAGPEINHDVSCHAAVSSAAGTAGSVVQNYSYFESLVLTSNYCSSLLPVSLEYFTAQRNQQGVLLSWKTGQADAIESFTVEKMTGNHEWTALALLPAQVAVDRYQFTDGTLKPGNNLYRLLTVLHSGERSYSAIRSILVASDLQPLMVYPNPATNRLLLTGGTGPATMNLFDVSGKLVWKTRLIFSQGRVEISLPAITEGVYMLQVGQAVRRLVIRR